MAQYTRQLKHQKNDVATRFDYFPIGLAPASTNQFELLDTPSRFVHPVSSTTVIRLMALFRRQQNGRTKCWTEAPVGLFQNGSCVGGGSVNMVVLPMEMLPSRHCKRII
jgi:hypothetical protein